MMHIQIVHIFPSGEPQVRRPRCERELGRAATTLLRTARATGRRLTSSNGALTAAIAPSDLPTQTYVKTFTGASLALIA